MKTPESVFPTVAHIKSKNGQTRLLCTLPVSLRAGMAEAAQRLGMTQQQIVRSAIASFLVANQVPDKVVVKARKPRTKKS